MDGGEEKGGLKLEGMNTDIWAVLDAMRPVWAIGVGPGDPLGRLEKGSHGLEMDSKPR